MAAIVAAAPAGATTTCTPSASAWIELQANGPLPAGASVEAGKELDLVNQADVALTVTSSLFDVSPTLQPGDCVAVVAGAGNYAYTVSGYPTGDVSGSIQVTPAPTVTISPHAPIAYGQRTKLSGTASGEPGTAVVVLARPLNATKPTQVGTVVPVGGAWTLSVAPKVGTEYIADFADAQDQRLLNVLPIIVVRRDGHTISALVTARLSRPTLWLFRYTPAAAMLWTGFRSTIAGSGGRATFKNVPTGRYYVAVLGGSLYLDAASEPFNIRR
ncbi:MAG TPA: hypothetical protein VFM96_08335 [Gaiellaceae bacterium]|nr:hypothetical protein [Gaiellaceae bacterium]